MHTTYLPDAGGGTGDEDNLAGDIFTEEGREGRDEELEGVQGREEEAEGEESEDGSCKVQELVDYFHGRG